MVQDGGINNSVFYLDLWFRCQAGGIIGRRVLAKSGWNLLFCGSIMTWIYAWFWRLLIANPMIVRIIAGGSRRRSHLWVRMGYLGVLVMLVLFWLMFGGVMGSQVNMNELAKAGTQIFALVSYGQVVLVCLLAPVFMAGAIASEQSGKTYNILLTTPLSNLQIVFGSLFGRLFFVLVLLMSSLPLFSILMIFGGVPIRSVFVSFAVAGLTALLVGAVAVTLSVFRAGGRKAVFTFVISVAAYLVAGYLFDTYVMKYLSGSADSTTWLTPLHPLLVLRSVQSANYRPPSVDSLVGYSSWLVFYLSRPFAAYAVISTAVSLLLLLTSAVMLRRIGQGEGRFQIWLKRKLRLMGNEGGTARRRPAREVWTNPIAWREANTRGKVAAGIIARYGFFFFGIVISAVLLLMHHHGRLPALGGGAGISQAAGFHVALKIVIIIEIAVITLVAMFMSAGCVSREREDGTLDLMLTTPITPKQYIWGKLRGLVSYLSLLISVPVLTLLMTSLYAIVGYYAGWPGAKFLHTEFTYGGAKITHEPLLILLEAPLLMLFVLVPFVALCVATGMTWSLKSKGVLGAVVPSVMIIGIATLVLGLCGLNAAGQVIFIGPILNAFSPVTSPLMWINPWECVSNYASDPVFGRLSLLIAAIAAAVGYSVIVYAMIIGMVKGFDHTVRKLSGAG